MTALRFLAYLIGVPIAFGLAGAGYLLGANALLKRLGVDTSGPWYHVGLVSSFLALLFLIVEFSP